MITKINKTHLPQLREMMRQFRQEAPLSYLQEIDNQEQFDLLMMTIIAGAGIGLINNGKGFIVGLIAPSIWCNKTFVLNELAWFVKPEFRNGFVAARLLKEYLNQAEKLKIAGRINAYTMAKMSTSQNIKYEKLGFQKLDEIWIR